MSENNGVDFGLDDEMNSLINDIQVECTKSVLFTEGNLQFIYENGQIYKTNAMRKCNEIQISKEQFRNESNEIAMNYRFNNRKDIIIE